MQKEHTLTSNDYFQRIIIFIALVVLVLIVQIPLSFIMMGKLSTIGSLAMSGGYILGFVIAIWIAVSVYRHYVHPIKKVINGHDIQMILVAYGAFFVIQIALNLLNQVLYHQTSTANNQVIYQIMGQNHLTLILMGITAVFCSPILEELVFRGFLIGSMFTRRSRIAAIIVSGILFSFSHMEDVNVISFLTYAILGGTLAYLYVKTENIKVPIGLHFLNNLIAMSMMLVQVLIHTH